MLLASLRTVNGASPTDSRIGRTPHGQTAFPLAIADERVDRQVELFGFSMEGEWRLEQLEGEFDRASGVLWVFMRPRARPSFTADLLRDLNAVGDAIEAVFSCGQEASPMRFVVLGSRAPGIYNLGGDLALFQRLIEARDRDSLRRYAHACVALQHRVCSNFHARLCMIALVQGDALGGGFEAALANDVIIAERQAKFGLPETLFNLFPGMGAYSFLSRRIGAAHAERMILSGKIYGAEELHEMGVIDVVADEGQGEAAAAEFFASFSRSHNARQAVLEARKIVNPVSYQELVDVADVWVDAALRLSPSDLRRMSHLAKAQERRWAKLGEQVAEG